MPELPEVETMCRGIADVVGGRIVLLELPRSTCRPIALEPGPAVLRRRLRGARIEGIERLGKRVVLRLASQERLVYEPRMTGLVLLEGPPTSAHLRARLRLEGAAAKELLYWDRRGLSTLRLLRPAELAAALGPARLGPDALALGEGELAGRLADSRRPIKVALLDQRALAGVGNIYASESLFVAGLAPTRPCASLAAEEWRALEAALRDVLEEAIRHEGSTLGDGTYRNALSREGGYQALHRVYAREGEPCRRCGPRARVARVVLAQRATFFCPRCQA